MSKKNALLERLGNEIQLAPPPDPVKTHPTTPSFQSRDRASDEILKLIQRVFAGNGSEAPRLVVFAGVEHGSGCTSVCALAGEALSSQGTVPVCLIDANPFTPGLYHHFGIRPGRPMATIDPQPEPVRYPALANQVPGRKLWLMSCTDGIADVQSIINTDKCRSRLLDICAQFDYVLIDAPPVSASIQTLMLGRIADGLILVLEADYTRREAALRAKESLESAGVRLLGAVLNKRTYPIPESIYRKI